MPAWNACNTSEEQTHSTIQPSPLNQLVLLHFVTPIYVFDMSLKIFTVKCVCTTGSSTKVTHTILRRREHCGSIEMVPDLPASRPRGERKPNKNPTVGEMWGVPLFEHPPQRSTRKGKVRARKRRRVPSLCGSETHTIQHGRPSNSVRMTLK